MKLPLLAQLFESILREALQGYWLSDSGEELDVRPAGSQLDTHMDYIQKNPQAFDLSSEEAQRIAAEMGDSSAIRKLYDKWTQITAHSGAVSFTMPVDDRKFRHAQNFFFDKVFPKMQMSKDADVYIEDPIRNETYLMPAQEFVTARSVSSFAKYKI